MKEKTFSEKEVNEKLKELKKWSFDGKRIHKTFLFEDYGKTIEFVDKVAEIAERLDHHPEMLVSYGKVAVSVSTHKPKGITKKDFALAEEVERTKK